MLHAKPKNLGGYTGGLFFRLAPATRPSKTGVSYNPPQRREANRPTNPGKGTGSGNATWTYRRVGRKTIQFKFICHLSYAFPNRYSRFSALASGIPGHGTVSTLNLVAPFMRIVMKHSVMPLRKSFFAFRISPLLSHSKCDLRPVVITAATSTYPPSSRNLTAIWNNSSAFARRRTSNGFDQARWTSALRKPKSRALFPRRCASAQGLGASACWRQHPRQFFILHQTHRADGYITISASGLMFARRWFQNIFAPVAPVHATPYRARLSNSRSFSPGGSPADGHVGHG